MKDVISLHHFRKEFNLMKDSVKQRIKFSIVILIIVIAISFAVFSVVRYNVEGEKKVPFSLGKIIVISTARTMDADEKQEYNASNVKENNQEVKNGENEDVDQNVQNNVQNQDEKYIWDERVVQTNDIYIFLDRNKDYEKNEIIKSVKIENLKVIENVKTGNIQAYMPNSLEDGLYRYLNEYLINSSLTYIGATADNKKNLEIGNQGGCICLSFANVGVGDYKSNDDQEMQQGGTILQKMNVTDESLKFKVSFDLIIEALNLSYKTNIELELPAEDLVGVRETHKEITDFSNIVFKRI